ncbi:MAG: 30S ribosomal protein S12 methylthiotransferase RimO [Phycisphaerales bacterium]
MPQTVPDTLAPVSSVSLVSLGCPKNTVDSEKMLGMLAETGLSVVSADAGDDADAVVINTCGFLEASKQESLEVIQDALARKADGRVKRVVVAGCLVQRHRAKMLDWAPGIDALVGVFDRDKVVEAVTGVRPTRSGLDDGQAPSYWIAANALTAAKERGRDVVGLTVQGKDGKGVGYFESDAARLRITPRHYAYLRVSEGCNQKCAFCTIPSIRGKMRSKNLDAIVGEAKELLADGAFELNLIGQDTTSYGDDIGRGLGYDGKDGGGLPELLRAVNDAIDTHAAGHGWARLMYAYPSTFTDEMIDAIADLPHVVKYIDIPLQHASDRMLTAMRRNVRAEQQRELMHKLRERIPGMAIRTTLISGFPGETDEDHEQLLEFIEEVGFDMLGVFEYSQEDGTVAGTMECDPALRVPAEVKARRREEIMALQQQIAFEQAAYLADQFDPDQPETSGCQFDVLIDEQIASAEAGDAVHHHKGRAYFQAPLVDSVTFVQSRGRLAPGELVRCTVVGSEGYDLVARPVEELKRSMRLPILG